MPLRVQSDHAQSSGSRQSSGGGGGGGVEEDVPTTLSVSDALNYLETIQQRFGAESETYLAFLDIMEDFENRVIGTLVVITRVTELFKGDPELAEGFNLFLPPGYRIVIGSGGSLSAITPSGVAGSTSSKPLPPRREDIKSTWKESPHVPKINPELKTALDYFGLVRETYVEEPEVCAAFQKLIADAGAGKVSVEEVWTLVPILFKDHPELLDGLAQFVKRPKRNAMLDFVGSLAGHPVLESFLCAAKEYNEGKIGIVDVRRVFVNYAEVGERFDAACM